jgi:hypothetical protein
MEYLTVSEDIQLCDANEASIAAWVKWLNDPEIFANTLKIPQPYTTEDGK